MSRKLGKTLQRIYRREIPGTDGYPAKMDFLGDVPFYAVTQVLPPGAKRTQYLVEFTRQSAAKLISGYNQHLDKMQNSVKLRSKVRSLMGKVRTLKGQLTDLQEEIAKLEALNTLLQRNLDKYRANEEEDKLGVRPNPAKSQKNYLQVMEDNGQKLIGPPLQGGAPFSRRR